MNIDYTLNELNAVAKKVVQLSTHKTLLFYGAMGVGKTTLIKEICKVLQIEDTVSSPTFSLVNEYRTLENLVVYHFDFYRIEKEEEAFDMGVEDYWNDTNWCLIEWPENVKNLLPLNATRIEISLLVNGKRNIQLKTN